MANEYEELGRLRDLTTGYELVVRVVHREDYAIEYEMQVFRPNPPEGDDGYIETVNTVPLRSDGCGIDPLPGVHPADRPR